ncbi:MAG TPA: ORF6N domain-containing protein [Spirochaetota bacterium]|nr:ORF6N domain-containing protein [Spirochaetota bacterium]HPN29499.1 ORF6N domain-containing protein [bacterium]HPN29520.1 ORF6N domain-containing protein [bacterium]
MKNDILKVEIVQNKILNIRGQAVILDRDLAELYGVEPKYLNRQMKRNQDFFPEDFVFQLTPKDINDLRCQNVTANISSKSRTLPYAFTEYGAIHIAHFLKSVQANTMSIYITRAFVKMRQTLQLMSSNATNLQVLPELLKQYNKIIEKLEKQGETLDKHDNQIKELSQLVDFIIKSMLPNTRELKIKGFQLPEKK